MFQYLYYKGMITDAAFYYIKDSEFISESFAAPITKLTTGILITFDINCYIFAAKEYENHKQNVALNLALFHQYLNKYSFDSFIIDQLKTNPELTKIFSEKYSKKINKYLLLI